ncbi:hypothetical protein A9K65_023500 [Mesorhizobium sp. WSM1497]|nr:hypothetical protein A9K65_023500 [Mesorhizobium sp. WSM1497]
MRNSGRVRSYLGDRWRLRQTRGGERASGPITGGIAEMPVRGYASARHVSQKWLRFWENDRHKQEHEVRRALAWRPGWKIVFASVRRKSSPTTGPS